MVSAAGLRLEDFRWARAFSKYVSAIPGVVPVLMHRSDDAYFTFDLAPSKSYYGSTFQPGWEYAAETIKDANNWEGQLLNCRTWLSLLVREVSIPDLWSIAASEGQFVEEAAASGDVPLDEGQQARVTGALGEIEQYAITAASAPPPRQRLTRPAFEYLKAAAARLGIRDFLNAVGTTMVKVAIDIGLDELGFNDLLHFALITLKHAIAGAVGVGNERLPKLRNEQETIGHGDRSC